MANPSDRDLGMGRPITRRDFLNGVGLALTGSLAYPWFEALGQPAAFAPEKAPGYYPPAQMGLRGSHDGFWEVAHALRDGKTWDTATVDPDEVYDLVVVGAGKKGREKGTSLISGREKGQGKRDITDIDRSQRSQQGSREKGQGKRDITEQGKRDITDIDRLLGNDPRGRARKRLMQAA